MRGTANLRQASCGTLTVRPASEEPPPGGGDGDGDEDGGGLLPLAIVGGAIALALLAGGR